METVDLTKVADIINTNKKRLPFNKYKHLFTKVAFDVFQLNSSNVESYWILEKDEDGSEYLAANYEVAPKDGIQVESGWEALSDKEAKNVTLSYKGVPIKRLASSEFGFNEDDVGLFKKALVNKLSSDKEFVNKLMNILTTEKRNALVEVFPELV